MQFRNQNHLFPEVLVDSFLAQSASSKTLCLQDRALWSQEIEGDHSGAEWAVDQY